MYHEQYPADHDVLEQYITVLTERRDAIRDYYMHHIDKIGPSFFVLAQIMSKAISASRTLDDPLDQPLTPKLVYNCNAPWDQRLTVILGDKVAPYGYNFLPQQDMVFGGDTLRKTHALLHSSDNVIHGATGVYLLRKLAFMFGHPLYLVNHTDQQLTDLWVYSNTQTIRSPTRYYMGSIETDDINLAEYIAKVLSCCGFMYCDDISANVCFVIEAISAFCSTTRALRPYMMWYMPILATRAANIYSSSDTTARELREHTAVGTALVMAIRPEVKRSEWDKCLCLFYDAFVRYEPKLLQTDANLITKLNENHIKEFGFEPTKLWIEAAEDTARCLLDGENVMIIGPDYCGKSSMISIVIKSISGKCL